MGVPLVDRNGHVLGSFEAVNSSPRSWNEEELRRLSEFGDAAQVRLEAQTLRHRLRRQKEHTDREIKRLVERDPVTELPNIVALDHHLNEAYRSHQEADDAIGLIVVDLDDFVEVNEHFGTTIGDRLLTDTGKRMRAQLRLSDTLFRFGADEFVVVVESVEAVTDVHRVLERLAEALEEPFRLGREGIDNPEHLLHASMGYALAEHGEEGLQPRTMTLLERAWRALFQARKAGGRSWERFSPST